MIGFFLQSHRLILYPKRQQKVHLAKRFEISRSRQHGLVSNVPPQDATDLKLRRVGSGPAAKGLIHYPTLQTVWVPLCWLKPPLTTTAEQHNKHHWNIYLLHFIFTLKLYWKVLVLIQIISEKSFWPSFRLSPSAPCGAYQAPIQYIHHWISLPYQSWGWIEYPIYLRDGLQSYSAEWKRAPISYFSSGLRCLGPLVKFPVGFISQWCFSYSVKVEQLINCFINMLLGAFWGNFLSLVWQFSVKY